MCYGDLRLFRTSKISALDVVLLSNGIDSQYV